MHHRKADLIDGRVIRPNLSRDHVMLGAQTPRRIEGIRRHVQKESRTQPAEGAPLGHRLEGVDGFGCFDLDCGLEFSPALLAVEQKIGIHGDLADANRCVLLRPWVDGHLELALVASLQDSNNTIVLELLADRAHEDRAH